MGENYYMKAQGPLFLDMLDAMFFFTEEKVAQNGEDSVYCAANEEGAIAAVFDGCGGAGAKRYDRLQGKTGAYLAARAANGAIRKWFLEACDTAEMHVFKADSLKQEIKTHLAICAEFEVSGGPKMKGSMSKDFPTTLVAIVCAMAEERVRTDVFWAGDSRGYLLNEDGLFLLTRDDLVGADLYENYSCDGVMNNVISNSRDFEIHQRSLFFEKPCMLITATDGCFAYYSTPMEFEFVLLESLIRAEDPTAWTEELKKRIGACAGDDYSMSALAFGFGTFENMKKAFVQRLNELHSKFIVPLTTDPEMDKGDLWKVYREEFLRYL